VTVTTFQRARSEEQRGVRRRAILDTAAAMLLEMPVADLSLNELSRRVGLAKSNVLNYFESREAVLLELASAELDGWVEDLASALSDISPELPLAERTDLVVAAVVRRLALRPVLCDLISAQASVLERNVSTEVVLAYKRSAAASLMRMLEATVRALPEIGEDGARRDPLSRRRHSAGRGALDAFPSHCARARCVRGRPGCRRTPDGVRALVDRRAEQLALRPTAPLTVRTTDGRLVAVRRTAQPEPAVTAGSSWGSGV
jgi:AcrR family transcriptional regulator